MKKMIIALLAVSALSGCASELRDEAAEDTNANILQYVVKFNPDCNHNSIGASLYQANLKEMNYRESKGAMNAQEDAVALNNAKQLCIDRAKQAAQVKAEKAEQEQAQYEAEAPMREARAQEKRQQQIDNQRLERLCEAAHPYMASQCMYNEGVNTLIDAL